MLISGLLIALCFGFSEGIRGNFLKTEFLQDDYDFVSEYEAKEGPMVDPPAGHGLPEFSAAPYELTPDELLLEYDAWKLLEAAAEAEFYEQTDQAIADAEAEKAECATLYETEEEIASCEAEADLEIETVYQSVEDLQASHGAEEEIFEAAVEFLIAEYYAENPDYVSELGITNPNEF